MVAVFDELIEMILVSVGAVTAELLLNQIYKAHYAAGKC